MNAYDTIIWMPMILYVIFSARKGDLLNKNWWLILMLKKKKIISQMIHAWNIYLQNWVMIGKNVGIHIAAPWFASGIWNQITTRFISVYIYIYLHIYILSNHQFLYILVLTSDPRDMIFHSHPPGWWCRIQMMGCRRWADNSIDRSHHGFSWIYIDLYCPNL